MNEYILFKQKRKYFCNTIQTAFSIFFDRSAHLLFPRQASHENLYFNSNISPSFHQCRFSQPSAGDIYGQEHSTERFDAKRHQLGKKLPIFFFSLSKKAAEFSFLWLSYISLLLKTQRKIYSLSCHPSFLRNNHVIQLPGKKRCLGPCYPCGRPRL